MSITTQSRARVDIASATSGLLIVTQTPKRISLLRAFSTSLFREYHLGDKQFQSYKTVISRGFRNRVLS
ncbi:MAG: hypothetical protein ABWJ42_01800 [Sulfolobales archaeon]